MLKLGNKDISKFYLGNKEISKVYLGSKLVFEKAKPIFIDYIESSGTQWLDTGLYLDNYRIVIEAQGTEAPKSNYTILCAHLRDYAGCALFAYNKFWGLQSGALTSVSIFEKTKLDATFNIVGGFPHATLTINGNTVEYQRANTPPYPRHNIQIFSSNASTHVYKEFIGKVFGFEIYDLDGNLLMNAKPCLHPETFEVCMYDTVSKQYLYNQGSGEFIPAPRFVEYIQSTGTQYIDTGIKGTDVTRFVIKGTCVENGVNNTQLLGGISSSSQTFFGNRYTNNVAKWYCVDSKGTSIGNPHNLSIIDATIESSTSQYGTLTDVVEGTVSEFIKFSGNAWGFPESNLLIFGGYSSRRSPNATCYLAQLYTADGLVRDLRPCLKGNTPCMYDMVTKQYFYNQGTGEFVKGEL